MSIKEADIDMFAGIVAGDYDVKDCSLAISASKGIVKANCNGVAIDVAAIIYTYAIHQSGFKHCILVAAELIKTKEQVDREFAELVQ